MTDVQLKGSAILDTTRPVQAKLGEKVYDHIVSLLDERWQPIFRSPILASEWYPLEAYTSFLATAIQELDGGEESQQLERSERVFERHLKGIYRSFVSGTPEAIVRRISVVHNTYFKGVKIHVRSIAAREGIIEYEGFQPVHRLIGYAIQAFYRVALRMSGAQKVETEFTIPIEAGFLYSQLTVTWE